MRKWVVLLLVVSLSLLTSCSSLRKSINNEHRIMLDKTNFKLIEGKYNPNSVEDKGSSGFISSIFSGGYKMLKFFDYTPESCNNSVKIEVLDSKTLSLSYTTNKNTIKTAKLKGKLKDGYFVLKRNHMLLPFIITNIYQNRQFRIGLLSNGNLITDFNEVSLGTVYVIIPFYNNDKSFDVEYERIRDNIESKSPEEYPQGNDIYD